ncbi:MAG: HesA/MoeB/ThiF family protein [Pirellulaceae bacterium]|nr:HesA/MoeB/ThiF family protein [Pirellulaceae bacterium]
MANQVPKTITPEELDIYQWQLWVSDFGLAGQEKLRQSSVLVSRLGGLGGLVAYQLAAAGVGKLVLAHAGNVKPSDLNRQLLMTHDWIGKPRIESAQRRLSELNPRVEIVAVNANVHDDNAAELVSQVDLVVDCAPLFEERLAMNRAAVNARKPVVECAMYDLEASLTSVVPGQTPCLACLTPTPPTAWRREFPVFGAVSGTVGCMAAMEVIKILAGFGEPLLGTLLTMDLRSMQFRRRGISRREDCEVCGPLWPSVQAPDA